MPTRLVTILKNKHVKLFIHVLLFLAISSTIFRAVTDIQSTLYRNNKISNNHLKMLVLFKEFDEDCFSTENVSRIPYNKELDKRCIDTLGKISQLIDSTPDNTAIEAELWEIGRIYLSSVWLSNVDSKLNDRIVYQFEKFYGYGNEPKYLYGSLNADIKFREMIKKVYDKKLLELDKRVDGD